MKRDDDQPEDMNDGGDDDVGYGKPPRKHRFKKGKSGNPKGRPKGAQNVGTDLREELAEPITVQEGGKAKKISKRRAIVKSIVNNSIKNNGRAVDALIKIMDRSGIPFENPEDGPISEDDEALLQMFLERMQRRQGPKAATDGAPEEEPPSPGSKPRRKPQKKPGRKAGRKA